MQMCSFKVGVFARASFSSVLSKCVLCFAVLPILATSGIEDAVKIWSPKGPVHHNDFDVIVDTAQSCQETLQQGTAFRASFVDIRFLQALLQGSPEALRTRLNSLLRREVSDGDGGGGGGDGGDGHDRVDDETREDADESNESLEVQCRQS